MERAIQHKGLLFVCFVALRPKSTAMVIGGRSVHLTTLFPGQAWTSSWPVLRAHTFPCNWQQPFLNDSAEGRRMTVKSISWSISTKVWDRAGIELATPGSAVRLASVARHVTDCATRPGHKGLGIYTTTIVWYCMRGYIQQPSYVIAWGVIYNNHCMLLHEGLYTTTIVCYWMRGYLQQSLYAIAWGVIYNNHRMLLHEGLYTTTIVCYCSRGYIQHTLYANDLFSTITFTING